ncbi:MAG: hypothetical protein ACPHJ3_04055 [Rubripirellula sp.]
MRIVQSGSPVVHTVVHFTDFILIRRDTPALFPDGKRLFAGNGIYDLQSGLVLGELKAAGLESAVVNDGLIIKCNHDQLNYWRRRRVEGSWSPLSFPEAWITGALALACLVNVVVYSHRQRNPD